MNASCWVRVGALASLLALAAPPARADPAADLQRLQWLAGCWSASNAESGSGEAWMAPAGASMLGVSRTVKGGRTVAHEFMQIRALADGRLGYIAEPSGQRRAEFALKSLTESEVVFENPAHDFPQRVAYRREAPDQLRARIEGVRNGALRVVEFPMHRTGCP